MAGHRAFDDVDRQSAARPLAKAQAKRQERFLAQMPQQRAMRALGALVARNGVIQHAISDLGQAGGCGAADEAVQNHRNAQHPCRRNCTGHGRNLAPAQTLQNLKPVVRAVLGHTFGHHAGLVGQTCIVDARAAPGPIASLTAEQRTERDKLELAVLKLRDKKSTLKEDEYYKQLEQQEKVPTQTFRARPSWTRPQSGRARSSV